MYDEIIVEYLATILGNDDAMCYFRRLSLVIVKNNRRLTFDKRVCLVIKRNKYNYVIKRIRSSSW